MPKGKKIRGEVEFLINMVIHERRIALPASRLHWYVNWFGYKCKPSATSATIRQMVKDGKLVEVKDGSVTYYKNRIK